MTNLLTYYHHSDLIWSLYLLCQRLGFKLHLMYGMEWYQRGFFKMYSHPRKSNPEEYFARRFLEDDLDLLYKRNPSYPPLDFITFQEACDNPVDLLLCSNREMELPLWFFKKIYKPNVILIRQVGNRFDVVNDKLYPHTLYSDKESFEMNKGHKILYHQEFDMDLFTHELPKDTKNIYTFQNNYKDYEPAERFSFDIQKAFPDYTFREYGRDNFDGFIFPKEEYIEKVKEANFCWQIKDWEGYSHNIHQTLALGRPMILRREDVKGKIFEPLCDETTTIFTDQLDRIRAVNEQEMSQNCRKRFDEVVNFKEEGEQLKRFFGEII